MELKDKGIFTISLDFELHWGVSDHRTIESYRENLVNTPKVVDDLLKLFSIQHIHATWATVGLLFAKSKADLYRVDIQNQPKYTYKAYSNYRLFPEIGESEDYDPFHFASSLIEQIRNTPFQEIATHTYSHYYCLEKGQTLENFRADLSAAIEIADQISLNSIVFPRNQYSEEHIKICNDFGVTSFRGNEESWIYQPRGRSEETALRRAFRLLDSYLNISGPHIYDPIKVKKNKPYNIAASRFLRPYSKKLKMLEGLRLRRIKSEMTKAAKENKIYHLWWHPHNFGANRKENLAFLEQIITHYQGLHQEYRMLSLNMCEISKYLSDE